MVEVEAGALVTALVTALGHSHRPDLITPLDTMAMTDLPLVLDTTEVLKMNACTTTKTDLVKSDAGE